MFCSCINEWGKVHLDFYFIHSFVEPVVFVQAPVVYGECHSFHERGYLMGFCYFKIIPSLSVKSVKQEGRVALMPRVHIIQNQQMCLIWTNDTGCRSHSGEYLVY